MFQTQHPWQIQNQQFLPIPVLNQFQTRSPMNVSMLPAPAQPPAAQNQNQAQGVLDKIPGLMKTFQSSNQTGQQTGQKTPLEGSPWLRRQVGDAWDFVKGQFGTPFTPQDTGAPVLPGSPMAQIQQPSAQAQLGQEIGGINPALANAFARGAPGITGTAPGISGNPLTAAGFAFRAHQESSGAAQAEGTRKDSQIAAK